MDYRQLTEAIEPRGPARGFASEDRMPERPISQSSLAAASHGALPAVVAIVLGVFVLFGVGFAGPAAIHNAAHDSRHSFAFPCH
jgi:cobalt transporter subunit CbtB